VGKRVTGMMGARSVAKFSSKEASQLFPMLSLPGVSPTTFMGLLGLTSGLTAWVGIHSVTKPPRRGQTAVVSGAAGATGSVAAQLARLTGARVVGIAGGSKKAAYLRDELHLDGAVDYKHGSSSVGAQLDELCPDGIDFYFDTVGGEALDEVLSRIRKHGRVVICGASSQYNGNLNVGVVRGPSNYLKLAERGALMIGYNVMSYFSKVPFAMLHILWLIFRGKIFMTEQVESGIGAFAPAMVKMLTGGHIGKLLVRVGDGVVPAVEPTVETKKAI
jgi:NADPH-dependent curcumin reductase CurA